MRPFVAKFPIFPEFWKRKRRKQRRLNYNTCMAAYNETGDNAASASSFGWGFQVCAGIFLFFKNLPDLQSIKMEGAKEDIEIYFSNGNKLYAQAKSHSKIGDDSHRFERLQEALASLEKKDDGKTDLLYISNYNFPIVDDGMHWIESQNPAKSLPKDDFEIIKNCITKSDFHYERLSIESLQYTVDSFEQNAALLDEAKSFFRTCRLDPSYAINVLKDLKIIFFNNCSDRYVQKSKSEIVYKMIVVVLDDSGKRESFNEVCPDFDYDEINDLYHDVIDDASYRYELVTKVLSGMESSEFPQSQINDFIKRDWKKYAEYFSSIPEDVREGVTKLFLLAVLHHKNEIARIKKGANLS